MRGLAGLRLPMPGRDLPGKRCRGHSGFCSRSPSGSELPVNVGGGHFTGVAAGKDQSVLLADPAAGYLEHIATDEDGLAGMREIDAFRAGNPAGPFLNPPAAVFLHDVMRCFAEQREDCIEYRSLQSWLVSLDSYDVVAARVFRQ